MRQSFDIGDLVEVELAKGKKSFLGLVTDKRIINKHLMTPELYKWHPDEYSCLIRFLGQDEDQWIRAKYLKSISRAT